MNLKGAKNDRSTVETASGHPLVISVGWTLVHFVWQAAVVGIVVAFALSVMQRTSAHWRYVVACLGLATMMAAPVVTLTCLVSANELAAGQAKTVATDQRLLTTTRPNSPLVNLDAVEFSGAAVQRAGGDSSLTDPLPARIDRPGVKVLATHTYPQDTRSSTGWIKVDGVQVPIDVGVEYGDIIVYQTLMFDTVAVDAKSGKSIWKIDWRKKTPLWQTVLIVELNKHGQTVLAVELFAANPEGSGLRAEFTGKNVDILRGDNATTVIVTDGKIEMIDAGGVVRAWASPDGGAEQLVIECREVLNEVVMRIKTRRIKESPDFPEPPVQVVMNTNTGAPADEKDPPHRGIRYEIQQGEDAGRPFMRMKMKWWYDMKRLAGEATAETGLSLEELVSGKVDEESPKPEPDEAKVENEADGWGGIANFLRARLTLQTE